MVRGDWVDPDAGNITFGEYANWSIEQRPVGRDSAERYRAWFQVVIG